MLISSVLISTGIMSNGTVLDATEAYSHERTSSEDIYPLSFQVGFHHHSSWNLLPSASSVVGLLPKHPLCFLSYYIRHMAP